MAFVPLKGCFPEGGGCHREGLLPRSWKMATFNKRDQEHIYSAQIRKAVPQITRFYAMKVFQGNNQRLAMHLEASW